MARQTQSQIIPELPVRIKKVLQIGELIYFSTDRRYVCRKHPLGKWVAEVRRREGGQIKSYPVRGFTTPQEARDYILTTRPDGKGKTRTARKGEHTVQELFDCSSGGDGRRSWSRGSPAPESARPDR